MTTHEPAPISRRSRLLRFGRWLRRPRTLGYGLFGLAVAVTLLGLLYLVTNWRGHRAWQRAEGDLKAQGVEVEFEAYVPAPIPDEDNFALHPFFKPLFDFKPGTQEWRDPEAYQRTTDYGRDLAVRDGLAKWSLAEPTDLGQWLEKSPAWTAARASGQEGGEDWDAMAAASAVQDLFLPYGAELDRLMAAAHGKRCRFPVAYDAEPVFGILLPHLAEIRKVGLLARIRAEACLIQGDSESAAQTVMFLIDLSETGKSEPVLIAQLVRCVILEDALSLLWEGMRGRHWSGVQLEQFQTRLGGVALLAGMQRSLLAEHAAGQRAIDEARRSPGLFAAILEEGDTTDYPAMIGLFWRVVPGGWFDFEKAEHARLFTLGAIEPMTVEPGRIDVRAFGRAGAQLERELEVSPWERMRRHRLFSRLFLPALDKAVRRGALAEVSVGLATTACAAQRYQLEHGAYPKALQDLVPAMLATVPIDLLTGEPMSYQRLSEDSYRVYSFGWNLQDDGGLAVKTENEARLELAQGDWVWEIQH